MRALPLLALLFAVAAVAAPLDDRMTLVDAIDAVRSQGYDVTYSSQLVKEWMLVRETPRAEDPIAALAEALAPYRLALAPAGDRWLVVRDESGDSGERAVAVPTGADVAVATEPAASPALDEITIVGSRHAMFSRRVTDQFLSGAEIRQTPHLADDAFRAFHRLPGVAASDFKAPFNLRGGAADEVAVYLNGIELIEPFHMRTLFQPLSIVDPGIIGEAEVMSGGFTAQHGNHMSGVIEIAAREPETPPVHEVGVSFVSAFARSEGEVLDGRASYLVSLRRGYLDLIADQLTDDGEELDPRYADMFARLRLSATDSLDLSVETLLANDDVLFVDAQDGEDFRENGNLRYLWLNAEFQPVPGIVGRTSLFSASVDTTENGSQINDPAERIFRYYDRAVDSRGLRTDWHLPLGDRGLLRVGGRYRDLSAEFDYRLNSIRRNDFVNNGAPFSLVRNILTRADGEDYAAYAAYRFRAGPKLAAEVGARWDRQTYTGVDDDSQISPRVNAVLSLSDRAELRFAWGEFHQPHAIEDAAIPDGDTGYHAPERAEHRIVGLRYAFANGIEVQADLYDKRYRDIRPRYENLLDIYEFAPESNFDRARIDPARGRAYGTEITLRHRSSSRWDWWLNYAWSKAEDTIDGADVPRSWDQRSALTASVTWRGDRWSASAVGRYRTGWPRTPLLLSPVLDGGGNVVGIDVDLTQRNTARFSDYSRLDIRISRHVPLRRGSFDYYFEIFNVFDAKNQCCTSNHVVTIGQTISIAPEVDDFLPRFPSFGFVWRFGSGAIHPRD